MPFRELDDLIPRIVAIDTGTNDESRPRAAVETFGDRRNERWVGICGAAHRALRHWFRGAIPVVDWNRDERRATRRLHGDVIGARDCTGHVFAAGRFVAPFHV